jgi:hypothetical protein
MLGATQVTFIGNEASSDFKTKGNVRPPRSHITTTTRPLASLMDSKTTVNAIDAVVLHLHWFGEFAT